MLALFAKQPRAFYMIFLLELWERFGFYTVQGILTLFFVRHLGYSDVEAYYTFGAYSALVYGMVVLGGYLGDRVLGTKRTIVLGLIVLASGYFSLALTNRTYVFLALGLICVGNGLFKANPSNLLAKSYEPNDSRLHGGFTLYYMAINLGSMIALFLGPAISSRYGYSYAYFMSGVGLLLALVNYAWQRQHIQSIYTPADNQPISLALGLLLAVSLCALVFFSAYLLQHVLLAKNLVWCILVFVFVYYVFLALKEKQSVRARMFIALILMIEAIVFFTLYQQMPTSLNLFAVNNVTPYFLGIAIDPQSFQALNPIWIVLISPPLAFIYQYLQEKKGYSGAVTYKFALGMTVCALSFMLLFFSRFFSNESGMVSSTWLIASYFFQSLGELLVSALGVAMVAELVPARMSGFVMGMWYLTSAVAGFIGAAVASYTALPKSYVPGVESLMIYTNVFAVIGIITFFFACLMWVMAPFLNRYLYKV